MNTKRHNPFRRTHALIAAVGMALALGLVFLGPRVASVLSGGFTRPAPGGAFEYAVHREPGLVEIDVTFSGRGDQADIQRYLDANAARAQALLRSAAGQRLRTTITFARPLAAREVEELLRDAGVEAASYTQVGWTADGQRMASTIFKEPGATDFDLERAALEAISSDPAAPDYGATMAGFMVVDGVMTVSEQSLGRLLSVPGGHDGLRGAEAGGRGRGRRAPADAVLGPGLGRQVNAEPAVEVSRDVGAAGVSLFGRSLTTYSGHLA